MQHIILHCTYPGLAAVKSGDVKANFRPPRGQDGKRAQDALSTSTSSTTSAPAFRSRRWSGGEVTWDKRKSNPGRGDYWACCPFHGEKTPSFHAENRKGRYHCFGCGVSGDHFTFLVEQEGLSFPEAVTQLAADAGLPLPERDPGAERAGGGAGQPARRHGEGGAVLRGGAAGAGRRQGARLSARARTRRRRSRSASASATRRPSRNALKEHLPRSRHRAGADDRGGASDRRRGYPGLLRPLPRPHHLPDHRLPRQGDRLRRAGARRPTRRRNI